MRSKSGQVLVLAEYYLPGFKAGGPIKSLNGLMKSLAGDIDCSLITRNYDFGDPHPYVEPPNTWRRREECNVFYCSSSWTFLGSFLHFLFKNRPKTVYINSFFSPIFSFLPVMLIRLIPFLRVRCILAPRGELGAGALVIKQQKKKAFIFLSRLLGIHRGITWHVTSEQERDEVFRLYGNQVDYVLASNIVQYDPVTKRWRADESVIRVIFLSRISVKKNLLTAIEAVKQFEHPLIFHIYGPKEDPFYWKKCEDALEGLPANIDWEYCGNIAGEKTREVFERYDIFLFPSFNENFGHVIAEALSVGCAVITSDQTPWGELSERKLGWICTAKDVSAIEKALEQYNSLSSVQRSQLRKRIIVYFEEWIRSQDAIGVMKEALKIDVEK